MNVDEVIQKIEFTDDDLEVIVDEWLLGYNTTDEIMNRINEVVLKRFGFKSFSWVEHKNKKVFFCDIHKELSGRFTVYGNFSLAMICKSLPADEKLLALYNLEKLNFTMDSNRAMKKISENASHILESKAGFYNLNILKRVVVKAGKSGNTIQFFGKTREEVLGWLVED